MITERNICEDCSGLGTVEKITKGGLFSKLSIAVIPCPKCNGKGLTVNMITRLL